MKYFIYFSSVSSGKVKREGVGFICLRALPEDPDWENLRPKAPAKTAFQFQKAEFLEAP
jgi:hypothetical protein